MKEHPEDKYPIWTQEDRDLLQKRIDEDDTMIRQRSRIAKVPKSQDDIESFVRVGRITDKERIAVLESKVMELQQMMRDLIDRRPQGGIDVSTDVRGPITQRRLVVDV